MNRKNQYPNATDKHMKSKYLQKQKSPLHLSIKKIMLTDLCQQQKLKVGELIKINQLRRHEINQLNEQNARLKNQIYEIGQKNKKEISDLFEELTRAKSSRQLQLKFQEEIAKYEEHILDIQILNKDLSVENQNLRQKINKIIGVDRYNRHVQTQDISKAHYSCQTKKIKRRDEGIQVQMNFYEEQQPISKETRSKSHSKINKKSMTKSQLDGSARISANAHEISYQSSKSNNKNDENIQNCLDELTKELLSIKQKKLSHLKHSLEASKAQIKKKQYRQLQQEPQQFIFEDLLLDKINTEQKSFDQNQLNRMLKSKNFSASKLLTVKGLMNQSTRTNKRSLESKNQNISRYDGKKSAPFNYEIKKQNESKGLIKKVNTSFNQRKENKNGTLDLDLLDLVDSMNK